MAETKKEFPKNGRKQRKMDGKYLFTLLCLFFMNFDQHGLYGEFEVSTKLGQSLVDVWMQKKLTMDHFSHF